MLMKGRGWAKSIKTVCICLCCDLFGRFFLAFPLVFVGVPCSSLVHWVSLQFLHFTSCYLHAVSRELLRLYFHVFYRYRIYRFAPPFLHASVYTRRPPTWALLHTKVFTHRPFHTQSLSYTEAVANTEVFTQAYIILYNIVHTGYEYCTHRQIHCLLHGTNLI